ncbi:MAG TPA: SprT-like domain-containing protein [Bryobacteraceae bacterium]|nr:SprT-like domain-containing protein [Bryobacteraceae bacterium]
MAVQDALLFETPEQIYARVFHDLRPRTAIPSVTVEFRPFANPDSTARLESGEIRIRMSDLLQGAPAPILEALAYVLLGKLLRKPVPAQYNHRYRVYLNRRDMRQRIHLMRQIRGRKFVSGPQGIVHNLEPLFEELNARYFEGLMARPLLGWSRAASRSMLGHYDPSHNAIIISRIFDRPDVPRLALEYVLFHEMLHLRFPVEARGARRRVHTKGFQAAEKVFEGRQQAKELLKKLPQGR